MNHQIESTVSLKSGFDLSVRFDYSIDEWTDIPAVLHLAPENCSPAEFDFIFTVENLQISNWCDKWTDCKQERLLELIYDQLDMEVLEHAQNDL